LAIFGPFSFGWLLGLFEKFEVAPDNGNSLGYFYFNNFFFHFHLNEQVQNMVCLYVFESGFLLIFWTFKLSFFTLLGFGNCYGYFFQNLGEFLQSFGHPEFNLSQFLNQYFTVIYNH